MHATQSDSGLMRQFNVDYGSSWIRNVSDRDDNQRTVIEFHNSGCPWNGKILEVKM